MDTPAWQDTPEAGGWMQFRSQSFASSLTEPEPCPQMTLQRGSILFGDFADMRASF
ncbi:hypothetical protein RB4193 [Rhodopirellula baltica SH 1]|uniref:Uncharacterized protein n=1 Tax=Rhodopirellula baltica (strain DSM 10527 / NCIMB 13988 / SH1) TaxID=243090 RepID=Q7UT10_RHOBA|nr:hypothetical protein RB4193 [Rhodopirellula baltica SH 1]